MTKTKACKSRIKRWKREGGEAVLRKTPDNVETLRSDIVNTALVIFAKKGYDATNMQDIADALGITRTPIYYHFENKKVLYEQAIMAYLSFKREKYSEMATNPNFFEEIREHLRFSCNHFSENVLLSALNYKEFKALQDLNTETLRYIRALKQRSVLSAIERGELRADADTEMLIHLLYVMCYGLMRIVGDTINDLSAERQQTVIALLVNELAVLFGNPGAPEKQISDGAKPAPPIPALRPETIKTLNDILASTSKD
jgi:AcrR family transcriptional regulator